MTCFESPMEILPKMPNPPKKCSRGDCKLASLSHGLCESHYIIQVLRPLEIERDRAQAIADSCDASYKLKLEALEVAIRASASRSNGSNGAKPGSFLRASLKDYAKFFAGVHNVPVEIKRDLRVLEPVLTKKPCESVCARCFKASKDCECAEGAIAVLMDPALIASERKRLNAIRIASNPKRSSSSGSKHSRFDVDPEEEA